MSSPGLILEWGSFSGGLVFYPESYHIKNLFLQHLPTPSFIFNIKKGIISRVFDVFSIFIDIDTLVSSSRGLRSFQCVQDCELWHRNLSFPPALL